MMTIAGRNSVRFLLATAVATCLLGCGPGGPETIPIRGTVKLENGSVPTHCTVYFQPTEVADGDPLRPATANVDEEGAFEVTSFREGDGLVPGTYQVKIVYFTLRPGGNPEIESHYQEYTRVMDNLTVESGKRQAEKLDYRLPVRGS